MSEYIMPETGLFEPCPDPWAVLHVFFNPKTKQTFPARCNRWDCFSCAKLNYYKVDKLAAAGNPERFITLTRAGTSPEEIRINLQNLIRGLRRQGLVFEYFGVNELHENGQAHLHLFQRGDFIPQELLSEMWERYTAGSYQGAGSFVVDIRKIQDNQNVKGYLLKYLKKTWEDGKHDSKSWARLQALYPGLNHYRMSRNWLPKATEKPVEPSEWQLIPKHMVEYQSRPLDPIDELFFTGNQEPLPAALALGTYHAAKHKMITKRKQKRGKNVCNS